MLPRFLPILTKAAEKDLLGFPQPGFVGKPTKLPHPHP